MIYWKQEYGVEIKRIPMKDMDGNIIYDKETEEPVFKEIEEPKLIYNAPYMEIINRKDYRMPADALMGQVPEWESVDRIISYDTFLRDELQGKYYSGTTDKIKDWNSPSLATNPKQDFDGNDVSIGSWKKEFIEWYGRIRVNVVEEELDGEEAIKAHELEDEFICVVNRKTRTLCSMRKNRFPMKQRPFGIDMFIPDDSGLKQSMGIYELMDPMQKAYDVLFNEFIYSVSLSNKPLIFFTPTGNMRDQRLKIEAGYMYPTSDPKSMNVVQFPQPNESIKYAMDLVKTWAQYLFGISDYAAGMESTIDPGAPAKKAEIVVEQGNVRLNMIIKRKNDTLKDIFKRWFMLYRDNMPENKFARISGEDESKDPWKFQPITFEDFALKSLPDFELTGNILNANKQLEANKKIAIYQMLSTNPLFSPNTIQGQQAFKSLTKWLIEGLDDTGLSRFIPDVQNSGIIYTPEEENAVMLQGQEIDPIPNEDHIDHIKKHMMALNDPNYPEQAKILVKAHIDKTVEMIKHEMASQIAMQNAPPQQAQGMGMPTSGGPGQPINNQMGANQVGGINPMAAAGGGLPA